MAAFNFPYLAYKIWVILFYWYVLLNYRDLALVDNTISVPIVWQIS